jgi:nucleoside-diphosphate-sugar epimerase
VSTDENLRWWQADVEDLDTTRRLVSEVKPDGIFHLGGLVNGAPELKLVVPTFHSLVTSTVNLLEVAAETGCRRVLLVGSLEEPTGSSREVCPTSPYGAAKWAASAYGRMFHNLFGLPVVIARTYMTYGPGQPTWKVIPSTILSLLRGEAPRLSSGRRELDWVYVDDVVDGLLLAASTPDIDGATVNLGSGRLTTLREVVAKLVELLAPEVRPIFHTLPDRPRSKERAANIAHTRATMGWVPATSLDDGLMRTVEWYRRCYMATERIQT